jgi:uncharacterized membrane protein YbhN (UPF0104 family)
MPVEGVLEKFGGVSLGAFALALILHVAKLCARARGWHNIGRAAYPENAPRFRDALGAFFVGVGVDSFVPARAGELLRVELVRRRTPDATFPGLVSTLFAEYVLDVVLSVVVVAIVLFTAPMPNGPSELLEPLTRHTLILPAVLGVVLLLVALVVRRRPNLRPLLAEARRYSRARRITCAGSPAGRCSAGCSAWRPCTGSSWPSAFPPASARRRWWSRCSSPPARCRSLREARAHSRRC